MPGVDLTVGLRAVLLVFVQTSQLSPKLAHAASWILGLWYNHTQSCREAMGKPEISL